MDNSEKNKEIESSLGGTKSFRDGAAVSENNNIDLCVKSDMCVEVTMRDGWLDYLIS